MNAKAATACPTEMPDATAMLAMAIRDPDFRRQNLAQHIQRIHAFHSHLLAATEILPPETHPAAHLPLAGIPINIKETIAIAGMQVRAGSAMGAPIGSERDAAVVQLLRSAGAHIIARSNSPEFAVGPETENLVTGRTRNPLEPGRSVGGSSGGAAALVATGGSAIGIGTDFGGSVRIPASFCGLVGFKPASAAVSKSGVHPALSGFADSLHAVGTICRSVRDTRLVYAVIAPGSAGLVRESRCSNVAVYRSLQLERSIQSPKVAQAFGAAIAQFQRAGHPIKLLPALPLGAVMRDFNALIADGLDGYVRTALSRSSSRPFSLLAELWRQATAHPGIHRYLFQAMLGWKLVKPGPRRRDRAIARTMALRVAVNQRLAEEAILILPTVGILAPRFGGLVRRSWTPGVARALQACVLCNMADLPAITLPAKSFAQAAAARTPGIMLVARAGQEALLFALAAWLETRI